ncbi:MAG: hypothetical protein JO108_13075 [Acidobacteriaceae bacterium]|nr:hypothetical protein [Acidobacteriaceae bacterium]
MFLVILELTVMRFAYNFNFSLRFPFLLLILWIFGICMVLMAGLVYLPFRVLAISSGVVILLHNSLDSIRPSDFGSAAVLWNLIHQPGFISIGGVSALVTYTVLPWVAVMAGGYCFGRVFLLPSGVRRRILLTSGVSSTLLFVAVRFANHYGDPAPWSTQHSALLTVLSFLNTTKYPASLDFVLMTLGPALLVLRVFDDRTFNPNNPLVVFGLVPLFYFILHFYVIHLLTVVTALVRYGTVAFRFVFNPVPSMGGPGNLFPPHFGYSLPTVYLVWLIVVASLYPVCRWFRTVKAERRSPWLSYL